MSEEIVQIKLTSGNEIICTFPEESNPTPDSFEVHSVLEMIPLSDPMELDEVESYMLRPFVTYTEDLRRMISINPVSVVFVTSPSDAIQLQYLKSVNEIQSKLGMDKKVAVPTDDPTAGNVLSFPSRVLLKEDDS